MNIDRLSVTIRADLGAELRRVAELRGESVSGFVAEAIERELRLTALERRSSPGRCRVRRSLRRGNRKCDASTVAQSSRCMTSLVLDAGAFIAWERGDSKVRAHLEAARRLGLPVRTTSSVIAQVWRDGSKQAVLARLVNAVEVTAPSAVNAKRAGELCRKNQTSDVVDAMLVAGLSNSSTVLTSDPIDITQLAHTAGLSVNVIRV